MILGKNHRFFMFLFPSKSNLNKFIESYIRETNKRRKIIRLYHVHEGLLTFGVQLT